jgi:spore coat protein U-like protein
MSLARPSWGLWLAGALVLPQAAWSATTVSCTATATSIAFGVYNPLSTTVTPSTGTLQVTCSGKGTGSTNVTVGVSLSTGLSGSFSPRKMYSGTNTLSYNIYWSTAYSQIMGDGTGGSFAGTAGPFTVTAGGSNSATGVMYGAIPAQQDVAVGSYSDVITMTVTY